MLTPHERGVEYIYIYYVCVHGNMIRKFLLSNMAATKQQAGSKARLEHQNEFCLA